MAVDAAIASVPAKGTAGQSHLEKYLEALAPCARSLALVPPHLRKAMTRLYPGFEQDRPEGASQLNVPKAKRQKRLVQKHASSGAPLLDETEGSAPPRDKTG